MALELCLLDDVGQPAARVEIGPEAHDELVEAAAHLPLLGRLSDYTEDVSYEPREVAALRAELEHLAVVLPDDLGPLVARLRGLCDQALRSRLGLEAIAD